MSGNPDNLRGEGFDGYLEKPFSMRELLVAVENALK
jgi:DNA-binding response OmpR family regulator